jgi:peptidoglycan/LPS O-acetylase OafA/YrhL
MTRLTQLDGLRGIAALIVVIFHLSLIAQPFLDTGTVGDAWWWMSDTPLRIATNGTQAVLLFFVLSGLVVALPALRDGFSWKKYYASRFLRLYLPAWGALALAAILIFLIPRDVGNVTSGIWISQANARSTPPLDLLADATLMKVGNSVDNVLWSLRWEIIFSLLLPVFVLVAVLLRRSWIAFALAMVGCVALTFGTPDHSNALIYLPVFMIGTLMAARLDAIQEWSRRRSRGFWVSAFATSLLFMIASRIFAFATHSNSVLGGVLWSLVGVGAAGIILSAIGFGPFRSFLNRRFTQYLGRISFSLYLIHVPILATLAYLLGDAQWWIVGLVGVPVSIGAATVFHRYVEVPSQRLAHRVGARVARPRVPAAAAAAAAPSPSPGATFPPMAPIEQAPHLVEYPHGAMLSRYAAMR